MSAGRVLPRAAINERTAEDERGEYNQEQPFNESEHVSFSFGAVATDRLSESSITWRTFWVGVPPEVVLREEPAKAGTPAKHQHFPRATGALTNRVTSPILQSPSKLAGSSEGLCRVRNADGLIGQREVTSALVPGPEQFTIMFNAACASPNPPPIFATRVLTWHSR